MVDAFTAFRYYYINKWYSYLNLKLDTKRLDYYKGIVIHGYKTLASEEAIIMALEEYKKLASELEVDEFDFKEYLETYNKQIKDVHNRGYF